MTRQQDSSPRFAVLASGGGSTLEFLLNAQRAGDLRGEIVVAISDKSNAGALAVANLHRVSSLSISPKDFQSFDAWDAALADALIDARPELVVLAGFLKKIGPRVLRAFSGRIVNTHPSLLPRYGGQGMYGRRVHEAVLAAQERETGVSIHLVNENFDEGEIIYQSKCTVEKNDDLEKLAYKVHQLEHIHYPKIIEDLLKKLDKKVYPENH